jgi:hypothetical protein
MKWLYLIGALVILQISAWAFSPPPQPKKLPESTRAYGDHEHLIVEGRSKQRQTAFQALEQPTGSRCTPQGRNAFIGSLGYYYEQRQSQLERYPETYGKLGADYIDRQWSSTDDRRIDRLTQEAYRQGYLKPDDFKGLTRKGVSIVLKDEKIIAKGCS